VQERVAYPAYLSYGRISVFCRIAAMSHTVELSDVTFARLQKLATPLVDSIETVIGRLTDFYEQKHTSQSTVSQRDTTFVSAPQQFNAGSPPDLTHTKVLSIKVGEIPLYKKTWNGLLFEIMRRAKSHLQYNDDAERLILVNFVRGKKEDEGYRFIPEIGLSVQGKDANSAWRGAAHIAQKVGIPIEAEFLWRNKGGALFPGKIGRLSV
jgi:hypothetical protein